MKVSELNRDALCISIAAAMLSGCGGSQSQMLGTPTLGPPGISAVQQTASASDASRPLLYVSHVVGQFSHSYSVIAILSLPQGGRVATITGYGYVSGVCSDASGNVWVPNLRHRHWYVDKFPHGATKPIEQLSAPKRWLSFAGCAVNPRSGDLAVMGADIYGTPYALIWPRASAGKPARYKIPFPPLNAAYDDAGNLFITGWYGGSDFFFEMGELAKAQTRVTRIQLDRRVGTPGGVQWDGNYVVVGTTGPSPSHHRFPALLYRVQVFGTTGKVVGVVQPQGLSRNLYTGLLFVLHDGSVIGVAGKSGDRIWAWPYPAGGKPTRAIAQYKYINGLAISK